jgi:radical SAM superfamily enzyme YgiQ (UPF0313 family)
VNLLQQKERNLKVLLVYPQYPDTFWSFKHALRFISKKAALPPLGLLTVAAMLPEKWEKKLVDMNTTTLDDTDFSWADYVFISAMIAQQSSVGEVINRCRRFGSKIVAGGPLFASSQEYFSFDDIDYVVSGEAENVLPDLLRDLEKRCAKHIYTARERPDMTTTRVPLWSLIANRKYQSMSIQYSRGCPLDCEFCEIGSLNGHVPRTKNKDQIVAELETLWGLGWRGMVFFVDDNFIGNKRKLKSEILPAIIEWMEEKKHPFSLFTQASINLSDDEELMRLMVEAGFDTVFVGIESPNEESLAECNKLTNKNRDLLASIKKIQNHGLQVQGGFIVGFDSDPPSIFRSQISFIQKSGIVIAMVGLLNALPGTRLYNRLKKQNRLLPGGSGDNTDGSFNFIHSMGRETLIGGYEYILKAIYSPKQYYERVKAFVKDYKPRSKRKGNIHPDYLGILVKTLWFLGIKDEGRRYYWSLLISTLLKNPRSLPLSISLAIQGFHLRKVAEKVVGQPMPCRSYNNDV